MSGLDRLGRELADVFEPALVSLRALVITGAGIALAFLPSAPTQGERVLQLAAPVALAYLAYAIGHRILARSPRLGLFLLELWVLVPLVIAVVAVAGVAWVTVQLAVPKDATPETTVLLSTISTAVNAFLTSAFIASATDRERSRLPARIRAAFQARYQRGSRTGGVRKGVRYVDADSDLERLVYSDAFAGINGWGAAARWARANAISKKL